MKKKVSIIIPAIEINDYILESVPIINKIDFLNFEIILVLDKKVKSNFLNTIIIASGKIGPAKKRDLGAEHATGDILAFLDDDAYPTKNWLKKAIRHFNDKEIAAVGGPAITPKSDGLLAKASGAVYESYLGGGLARNRYLSLGKTQEIQDWPTVNLLVRKNIFNKINGFDSLYYPGEDTKLCLDILNLNKKIIYEPEAIVYHHRRNSLVKHLKQVSNYAIHRGFFAKKHPETSLKLWYFVPSFFVIYLILIIFFKFKILLMFIYFYLFLLILDSLLILKNHKNIFLVLITAPLIFLTHVFYGVNFIKGLLLNKLDQ
jgi:GT2 family glycosyltransferase